MTTYSPHWKREVAIAAGAVFVLSVLHNTLLAGLIPPFHGPDEPAHFDYAQRIAEHGELPQATGACVNFSRETRVVGDALVYGIAFAPSRPVPSLESIQLPDPAASESRSTPGCGPAATYPPAYYATVALGYQTVRAGSFFSRLFASRMVSVLWGGLTAVAAFFGGLFFFRRLWDGVLLGLLVVLQPMVGFLSGTVNNDAALFASAAGGFAAIAAIRGTRHRTAALVALAVFASVGALSKTTFFLVLPVLFLLCAVALGPKQPRSWLYAAAALAVPVLLGLAWTFGWPQSTGGVLGDSTSQLTVAQFLREQVLRFDRARWLWVQMYWMTWGWVDTNLPGRFFETMGAVMVLSFVGVGLGWKQASMDERTLVILGVAATFGFVVLLYALEFLVLRRTGTVFIQGRYLLHLFPIHAAILVIGLRSFGRAIRAPFAPHWLLVPLLVVLNAAAFFRALARFYA